MIGVYFVSRRRNYPKERMASFRELVSSAKEASLALGTPVIIIGGILGGIFTPTEAAVVASLYALFLGLVVYRELTVQDLPRVLWDTLLHTLRVMFIISAAGFFGWLLIHQRIPEQVITGLTALTASKWGLLMIIIFILLVLGCFLEGIAVLVITIPVFMPLIALYNINDVQFGVVMTLCSMLGLLTPPVGMSLYAVSSISGVPIGPLTREMWPYLLGIFMVLLIMTFFPDFSLWLPNLLMGP